MAENKRQVSVNITKHERTFINFKGDEITREEALGIQQNTSKQESNRDSDEG